jgi:hypothetical protein
MAWADVFRVLLGQKTEAELDAERRFRDAIENHKHTNGEVRELQEKLSKARADVHARIDALATGGNGVDGRETQGSIP